MKDDIAWLVKRKDRDFAQYRWYIESFHLEDHVGEYILQVLTMDLGTPPAEEEKAA